MVNSFPEPDIDPLWGNTLTKNNLPKKELEAGIKFKLVSEFNPAGDQPEAIKSLVNGINKNENMAEMGAQRIPFPEAGNWKYSYSFGE